MADLDAEMNTFTANVTFCHNALHLLFDCALKQRKMYFSKRKSKKQYFFYNLSEQKIIARTDEGHYNKNNANKRKERAMPQRETITQKARAKINLTLDVGPRRDDGFHDVGMVMQSVQLFDRVSLGPVTAGTEETAAGEPIDALGNVLSCSRAFLSTETNLAYRALRLIQTEFQISEPATLAVSKRIPIGAGLGGGSTDAAAVLRLANQYYQLRLSTDVLEKLGARIGSDVPFCIRGGTQMACGRGEQLSALPAMPMTHVLLIKPNFGVSTTWAYQALDAFDTQKIAHPDNDAFATALKKRDLTSIAALMANSLEAPVIEAYAPIAALKSQLLENGAIGAMMSGSGSCVFGLFADEESIKKAARDLREALPHSYQMYATVTANPPRHFASHRR